jgi:6-phosphogluconolactonase
LRQIYKCSIFKTININFTANPEIVNLKSNPMNQVLFLFGLIVFSLMPLMLLAQSDNSSRYYYVLVGTYTSGKSEGIYVYKFDTETGDLLHEYTAAGVINPSFLALSPDKKFLYSVNEHNSGSVSAFKFNKATAELTHVNQQASQGGAPCYLSTAGNGKHLFTGNYSGGNISVFPIQKDGSLGVVSQIIKHEGSSVNKKRQEKPHVHSTVLTPDEKYLIVGDLGTDKLYAYPYNSNDISEPLAEHSFTAVTPGSGPRHLVFDTSGKTAYVVQELTAEVGVFRYENGQFDHLQTIPMTAEDFKGEVGAAEIRISPDGKFLYASNRGDANDIVIYAIDQKDGTLSFIDRQSTLGKTPRNFIIDPTGNYLLAANQNSDNIIVFKRDKKTGKLQPIGKQVEVGNPVYLLMTTVE